MIPRRSLALAAPLAGLLAASAMAGSASADTTQTFGCRASVARVDALTGTLVVEPFVADPAGGACATDSAGVTSTQVLNVGALSTALGGAPQVGPASATTTSTATDTALGARSLVSVSAASIPTPGGAVSIVGPAQATASYACVGGAVQAGESSTLSALQIGANRIALASPGQAATFPLYGTLSLAPIGSVSVNQNAASATSNTETLLDVHINGIADTVVGEAAVTQPASGACDGLSGGGGGPVSGDPGSGGPTSGPGTGSGPGSGGSTAAGCPLGTVVAATSCLLGAGPSSIFITHVNSRDIVGGRVVSLRYARRHYRSACLRGRGPAFVVVGTPRRDRITVRGRRMRVLGLGGNDTITVRGGSGTCVDGGAGNDRITNLGPNRVSLYGGAGANRIRVGNGPASISAGNGNNQIVAGTGRVVVSVGTGRNRITARGRHALVRARRGGTVAHLVGGAVAYARAHGVRRVFVLHR